MVIADRLLKAWYIGIPIVGIGRHRLQGNVHQLAGKLRVKVTNLIDSDRAETIANVGRLVRRTAGDHHEQVGAEQVDI